MRKFVGALALALIISCPTIYKRTPPEPLGPDDGVSITGHAAERKPDRDRDGLSGDVRTVVLSELLPRGNGRGAKEDVVLAETVTYDRDGNKIEEALFDRKHQTKPCSKSVYLYTEGKRTQEANYDADGKLVTRTLYSYTEGEKTGEATYKADGSLVEKKLFKYDSKQLLVRTETRSADGTLKEYETHAYDLDGRKIESALHDGDGTIRSRGVYSYEFPGSMTAELYDLGHGSYKVVYVSDLNGNVIGETRYDSQGKLEDSYTRSYDEKGSLTRTMHSTSSGQVSDTKIINTYDEKGRATETTWYEGKKSVARVRYSFEDDAQGNWIRCILVEFSLKSDRMQIRPSPSSSRAITYYTD